MLLMKCLDLCPSLLRAPTANQQPDLISALCSSPRRSVVHLVQLVLAHHMCEAWILGAWPCKTECLTGICLVCHKGRQHREVAQVANWSAPAVDDQGQMLL